MRKPYLCGSNKVNMPESGCGECAELAYRIDLLEDWAEAPLTTAEIEALTPIICYGAPCAEESRVCFATVCCSPVGCTTR